MPSEPCNPKPVSPVELGMNRISSALGVLEEAVGMLQSRCEPISIVTEREKEDIHQPPTPPTPCYVLKNLDSFESRIKEVTSRITHILNDLQI
jgi:hypothetical protein